MKMKGFIFGFLVTVLLLNGIYTANAAALNQLGQWSGDIYCGRVFVHNQRAYIYDADRLVIVDVSEPTSPQKLGEITLPMDITDVYVSGNYAYVTTAFEDTWAGNNDQDGLRIIDISDSSSPQEVGFYYKLSPRCVYVSGQYAYVGSAYLETQFYIGGFDIVDISMPSSPQLIGQYSANGIEDILSVDGFTYAVYIFSSRIGGSGGVLTFDTSDPASPQEINSFVTYSWAFDTFEKTARPRSIFRSNNLLFLATNTDFGEEDNRLFILDISEPDNVTQLSTYESPDPFYGVYVSGVYLYTASGNDLKVVDISNPLSPSVASQPYPGSGSYDVSVSGDYVYAAEGDNGLAILSAAGINAPPFGTFETPIENAVVSGSIPVSGWVLDDKDIDSVKIFRSPVAGEGSSPIFLGDAVLVEGARPDVAQTFPAYPMNSRAGWGYMLLTNFNMPNQGNGPVTLVAVATDSNGVQTTLGSKSITLDNAGAVIPFGAVDTPTQGGIASGTQYTNWGWALTPLPNTIPFDGSTIDVYVDGVNLGHPVYNRFRQDVAETFPGYNNSSGAGGYFYLDTTQYPDGVHTIFWAVTDNAGNAAGIGSRYFTIRNTSNPSGTSTTMQRTSKYPNRAGKHPMIPLDTLSPVKTSQGFAVDAPMKTHFPDENGIIRVEIQPLERIEIHLDADEMSSPLPVGSYFDKEKRIFYWLLGPGIKGTFDLEFIKTAINGGNSRQIIRVTVHPLSF